MLRGIALNVRVARTKGYTFDTPRNVYGGGDSPQKKTTARIICIDLFGKFFRFLNVVKLFSVRTLDSLVKEDQMFSSVDSRLIFVGIIDLKIRR